ncbi:MAG: RsmB/NOP family class I SAM-dependent RNA methyltransferase [Nitrospirae bacterium]|nr:RsmB/NOP family class I SAM-dependent RNA methyltransferase [Nitrospirota bacterium]MDA1304858.1 RsmB/NOP family class I SAM-dependent RNA methyltransferase [Nitrospirota bacterium]
MQPSARLAATIELLSKVEASIFGRGAPADRLVADYFRARRYAGSKDRRAITDHVYGVLRARALYLWALEVAACRVNARALLICHLHQHAPDELAHFGGEGDHSSAPLSAEEDVLVATLTDLDWSAAPKAARHNIPEWIAGRLEARFTDRFEIAAAALNAKAPLDIRVNGLRVNDIHLKNILGTDSEHFKKTPYSGFGYRATGGINLGGFKAYKSGLIEVQDEAAQVAATLVDAQPGHQVIDLCAGAGGKSLAVEVAMANKGQIHAFDISGGRLGEFRTRLQRAGCRNIQVMRIGTEAEGRIAAFADLQGRANRVIVDVPCSGSGTWRRSPDQRWRVDAERLAALAKTQCQLMEEGAKMVALGGRLIYMTCSVLVDENEAIIERFLADNSEHWCLLDYRDIWASVFESPAPHTLSSLSECLQLAPHVHETDGFFVAILEKTS